MFIQLEGDDVILTENVVALVREDGVTRITTARGPGRESVFTPMTLARRNGPALRKNERRKNKR